MPKKRKYEFRALPSVLYYTFAAMLCLYFESPMARPTLFVHAQTIKLTLPAFSSGDENGSPVTGYDMHIDDGHNGPYRCVLGCDRS